MPRRGRVDHRRQLCDGWRLDRRLIWKAAGALVALGLLTAAAPRGWRELSNDDDRKRLREWRDTWVAALAQANKADAARVHAEGALLQPGAALGRAEPKPGDYRCRVFKLGAQGAGASFTASAPFRCRIVREGALLRFDKLDGPQRPSGLLFPGGEARLVFLGALMLGDERRPLQHGSDRERDLAGMLERVGADRWRLVLPRPRWESLLDVIELVPAN